MVSKKKAVSKSEMAFLFPVAVEIL